MEDPVLDAHEVLPGFYLISGGPSPISIRDQMLRGWLVVERLRHHSVISDDARLLVVGAGVGGVTAAIWAAENGVETLLVDRAAAPFGLQRRATTRFLNPTQYDWPLEHWPKGVFPLPSHAPMPLLHPADWAGILAGVWETEFGRAESRLRPLLTYDGLTWVVDIDPDTAPPALKAEFAGGRTGSQLFAAIIWAAGSGREENRLFKDPKTASSNPIFEGRAFWSRDPFIQKDCGVLNKAPRVLISGGGDGGLQDYLRVVTKHDAAEELYRKLNIPEEIAHRIQSAEDQAHRGRIWVSETKRVAQEWPFLNELHQAHEGAVEDALSVMDVTQSLKQLFPTAPHQTVLAYREPYFTNYYGLNRFLVLLLANFFATEFGLATLRPQTVITDVSTAGTDGHVCMRLLGGEWEPAGGYATPDCHGKDHEVTFRDSNGNVTTETFNVIIVRHGAREKSVALPPLSMKYQGKLLLARPRHLLPYHLPI